MKYSINFLFLVCSLASFSQNFSSEIFHNGFVVTVNKDTIKGSINYNIQTNSLIIINRGKTQSFSSQRVFYFKIFDELLQSDRRFFSIPYQVNIDYKIPIFFELAYEGKESLITREYITTQTNTNFSANWGGGFTNKKVLKYSYYFMTNKGKITYFTGKKRDLLRYMNRKKSDIKKFIKDNRLRTYEIEDLIKIIAFYNSI